MSARIDDSSTTGRSGREHPATGATIALLVATAFIVLTQLYSAIPLISPVGEDLDADVTFALSTVFSLCYAAGFVVWGPLADQYGRKRIMAIGLIALAVATIGSGFASSVPMLAVLRGAQGAVASSFAPVALAYLSEAVPPNRRATAIGAMSTAFLVAGIGGQAAASGIALSLGWRWLFFGSGAVLALCLLGIAALVVEPRRAVGDSGLAGRFAAVGRVAIRPSVLLLSAAHLTLLLSFVAMYTALGPHVAELGLQPSQVIWMRLVGLPGMFASLLAGPLSRRLGVAGVARLGFGLAAAGLLLEAALMGSLLGTALTSLVFVTGVALAVPAMITLFGEAAAPNRAGGMALNGFVLFLGASIGPMITQLPLGFPLLLLGLAALMLIAVLCLTGFARLATGRRSGTSA